MIATELTMKAVLPEVGVANARMEDKKEQVAKYTLIAYDAMNDRPFQEIVTVRVWMGRSANASTVYASLWVHGRNYYTTGRGQAGGWGYHKISAAIDSAIVSAGIRLYGSPCSIGTVDPSKECSINGVGDTAIENALLAIGVALGYDRGLLYVVN